ncbi:MAG: phage minor capsid protein [Ruminococcus flavefaciens]|nr:phage minor capsid protein [Ruminococcus flavefaciens]
MGYGSGDGFGGWNCRHDWYPFFEGISRRAYSDERLAQLNEKNIEYNGKKYSEYEISQIQRRYEREIRAAKREQTAFRTAVQEADDPELKAVMQDSLNYANDVVRRKQAKMRDFIKQTGQDRDYFREQNYPKNSLTFGGNNGIINKRGSGTGIGDDEDYYEFIGKIDNNDKKAVAFSLREFEEKYKDSGLEHCRVITASGEIYEVHGNRWAVDTSLLGDKLKNSINEHNHVTGESQYSFSWEDLKSCIEDGTGTAFAYDEKYRYFMQFSDKIISEDDLYDAYELSKEEVGNARIFKTEIITDEDEQHEVVKRTCEKVGIKYGRNKK